MKTRGLRSRSTSHSRRALRCRGAHRCRTRCSSTSCCPTRRPTKRARTGEQAPLRASCPRCRTARRRARRRCASTPRSSTNSACTTPRSGSARTRLRASRSNRARPRAPDFRSCSQTCAAHAASHRGSCPCDGRTSKATTRGSRSGTARRGASSAPTSRIRRASTARGSRATRRSAQTRTMRIASGRCRSRRRTRRSSWAGLRPCAHTAST